MSAHHLLCGTFLGMLLAFASVSGGFSAWAVLLFAHIGGNLGLGASPLGALASGGRRRGNLSSGGGLALALYRPAADTLARSPLASARLVYFPALALHAALLTRRDMGLLAGSKFASAGLLQKRREPHEQ